MEQGKPIGEPGRETPMEEPVQIRAALAELQRCEGEFPIRVEGTHTLPYTSRIQHLDLEANEIHLKLIRPLPHEMAPGAPFEMTFSAGDQRLEAPMIFLGRKSYLLYRFTIPLRMSQCDRRRQKRYPFRPREKAYVLAQDAGVPGHGLAGPLVNLSLGGLAFRVDRILRLDDHLGIQPTIGFFERGRELPSLKIRDLPKLPLFETRGIIASAWERGGEVIVGIKFAELEATEAQQIQAVIGLRELMQRSPSLASSLPELSSNSRSSPPVQAAAPPSRRVNPAGGQTPDALARLGRRCTPIVLAMPIGAARDQVQALLGSLGYPRIQPEDTLEGALEYLRRIPDALSPLLVWEVSPEPETALKAIRAHQRELGENKDLPVALLQAEGALPLSEEPLIRPLAWPTLDPTQWLPVLDDLAGF